MIRRLLISLGLLTIFLAGGLWAYYEYLRPFRIATIGFSDTDWANWESAIQKAGYAVHRYEREELDETRLENYNLVFVRGQGLNLTPDQVERMEAARRSGTHFYVRTATNALSEEQNSIPEPHRQSLADYMTHGGEENLIGLAHYAAHHLGGRDVSVPPLVEKPQSGFFHHDEKVFESLEAFEEFQSARGFGPESELPKIALLGSFMDPQDTHNRAPIDAVLRALENGGARVYPMFGRAETLSHLKRVEPDLVLTFPHGRFSRGSEGEAVLKELDCPIVSALPLLSSRDEWLQDERGMVGGFMGQSITAPELDGIIEPVVVTSMEPNQRGLNVRTAMEDQMQARVNLALNWLKLRKKSNAEKKLVIVYYKSPGLSALSAGGLEVAPALWNTLKRLELEGYDLGDSIPESPAALYEMIQVKGKTLGQWALGAYEKFLDESEPELIPAEQYAQWFQENLSLKRQRETIDLWGDLPGRKMVTNVDGTPHLVVSRIQLGNVVIMPQPTVGGGGENENEISSIHGTDQAAPHFYLGAYLWARYGFNADAIMHFGTHGSLEFTYGKSNCLSRDCWPQILIGDVPHIYPYVINNVGEALVAKRRSNAVIVSHLTPPFMEAGLYGDLSLLHDKIHAWEQAEDPLLKEETLRSVTESVRDLKLGVDLGFDDPASDTQLLNDEELEQVHNYIHQLKDQNVTDGLHVIGRPLQEDQVRQTATAMLGEQGVDQLLDSIGKGEDLEQMEFRQELAAAFVSSVLSAEITVDAIFSAEEQTRISKAVEAMRAAELAKRGKSAVDGYSGATQKKPAKGAEHPGRQVGGAKAGHPGGDHAHRGQSADHSPNGKSEAESHEAGHPGKSHPDTGVHPHGHPDNPQEGDGNDSASRSVPHSATRNEQGDAADTEKESRRFRYVKIEGNPGEHDEPAVGEEPKELVDEPLWRDVAELRSWVEPNPMKRQALIELIRASEENAANLRMSSRIELDEIVAALNAEYISPSSGGDPLANPNSVPTGRNLYSINAEQTPTEEAWRVGKKLTEQMLESHRGSHGGQYPRQVAISLWGGEFIRGKGTALAQILYLMGLRPMWNSRGVVYDVEVIPSEELKRPRIDVLVQTSGQFRDAAASRIALMDKAVQIASLIESEPYPNYVREGTEHTEQALKANGISPKDAREFATARIFGSASNSSYGTQVMGMVEKGDTWEQGEQVARQYIKNMSGVYRDGDRWGEVLPGLLEAQMEGVDAVVHPRSSNTWGPLSLDHVYEFMGGISLAVRETTGKDPTGYFSDLRQPGRAKVSTSVGAIREEARTVMWNPKYIQGMQREGASAAASLTETVRNMYGWNVMQPSAIGQDMWDETYQVYIEDKHDLEMRQYFEGKNPYALQDMTAIMLETARKGYWTPEAEVLQRLAEVHTELVATHGAACSYETCGNAAFHEFLGQQLSAPGSQSNPETASKYASALAAAIEPSVTPAEVEGIEMNEVQEQVVSQEQEEPSRSPIAIWLCLALVLGGLGLGVTRSK